MDRGVRAVNSASAHRPGAWLDAAPGGGVSATVSGVGSAREAERA